MFEQCFLFTLFYCIFIFLFLIATCDSDACCCIRYLQSAKKCIDLCVYCITCRELADVIVKLNSLGVQVRVITDNEQLDAAGSQIGYFRMEG